MRSSDRSAHPAARYVGIDLAWGQQARTGLAVVDPSGALIGSATVRTDEEIDGWLDAYAEDALVVGIDAPLVVPNASGMRECEKEISRAYGRYGVGCHAAHRGMPTMDPPRAESLAARRGWVPDPEHRPTAAAAVALEVYPHAALVGLFGLGYRLAYKKGPFAERAAEFRRFAGLLTGIEALALRQNQRWSELHAAVGAAERPFELDAVEDELDAILCAHVAWVWATDRQALHVYGGARTGFVVAPPAPTHPAARPGRMPRSRR